jgi:hypothetical protein
VIEHLTSKHEALNSNPSTDKKKKALNIPLQNLKKQTTDRETIFANYISDKEIVSTTCKEHLHLQLNDKTITQLKKERWI